MVDQEPHPAGGIHRRWLMLATAGCTIVVLALGVVLLVVVDKPRFGWLVTPAFVPSVVVALLLGAILLLAAAWHLPGRQDWRGVVLFCWGLLALVSPLFGLMFSLAWMALVLSLPVVAFILHGHFAALRDRATTGIP